MNNQKENISFGLSRDLWLSLPQETKLQLNTIFKIPKSGFVHVMDSQGGKVTDDGHTEKDLSVVTEEAIRKYLGVNESVGENWESLFKAVLTRVSNKEPAGKVEGKLAEPPFSVLPNVKPMTAEEEKAVRIKNGFEKAEEPVAKKRGRPKKVYF